MDDRIIWALVIVAIVGASWYFIDFIKSVFLNKSLRKSVKWVVSVLTILLIPYFFVYFSSLIINTGEELSLLGIIDKSAMQGSFIFISTGISSAAFIDFVFNKSINAWHNVIYMPFFILVFVAIGLFSCIHVPALVNSVHKSDVDIINYPTVISITRIHLYTSFVYSVAVKWIIFSSEEQ